MVATEDLSSAMIILKRKPLCVCDCLEDHPTMLIIKKLLETIPDDDMEGLKTVHVKGRDD